LNKKLVIDAKSQPGSYLASSSRKTGVRGRGKRKKEATNRRRKEEGGVDKTTGKAQIAKNKSQPGLTCLLSR